MKSNRKVKLLDDDRAEYAQIVGGLVALLITIIVALLVYFSVNETMCPTTYTEYFYGYTLPTGSDSSGGSNYSSQNITLTYIPYSTTNSTMTLVCYNASGKTQTSPPKVIDASARRVTIQGNDNAGHTSANGGNPSGYSQINVTYTTKMGKDRATVDTSANTVFQLLPIIGIVTVGGILIGLVMVFGKSGKGGKKV